MNDAVKKSIQIKIGMKQPAKVIKSWECTPGLRIEQDERDGQIIFRICYDPQDIKVVIPARVASELIDKPADIVMMFLSWLWSALQDAPLAVCPDIDLSDE